MKVAIVHDWLVTDAGAEKVLKAIVGIYPNADIFTLVDFLSPRDRKNIVNSKSVKTSFIQKLPFAKKYFRNYLPFFPKAIESFDFSEYDLLISSSWAVAKGIKKTKEKLHISYCHTPIRYAWDLYDEYTQNIPQPKKLLLQSSLKYIKKWDIKTIDRVDCFIANSKFVQDRITQTYKRESTVIYPPVDTDSFQLHKEKEDYYITVSRLVSYKKIKLIVEAFNTMPDKKLIVIGKGEEYTNIKSIAQGNILLLGFQDRSKVIEYTQRAKAFLYAAVEDFGIAPIEAMACGTPVIALNKGGTAETIIDGVTGVHFQYQTIDAIMGAVKRFETLSFDLDNISKRSQSYAIQRFQKEMKSFVENKLNRR